jgi:hypothetical protein
MGLWDSIKKVGRGVAAVGTGGASEVAIQGYNAVTNKGGLGDGMFGGVRQAQAGDSSNYDYGGDPAYAQRMRDYYGQRGDAAQGRGAYQLDRRAATDAMVGFGGAMGDDRFARDEQEKALEMYRAAASGEAPSVARAHMRAGLEESSRLGQNMVAGAPGANPLLAATNAANASADAARRSTATTAAMEADEIARAREGYAGVAGAMRSADQAGAQSWLNAGQFGMGVEGQQAGLEMQQRGLNDEQQRAYEMYREQMERDALAGRMGYGNAQTQASMGNAGKFVGAKGMMGGK